LFCINILQWLLFIRVNNTPLETESLSFSGSPFLPPSPMFVIVFDKKKKSWILFSHYQAGVWNVINDLVPPWSLCPKGLSSLNVILFAINAYRTSFMQTCSYDDLCDDSRESLFFLPLSLFLQRYMYSHGHWASWQENAPPNKSLSVCDTYRHLLCFTAETMFFWASWLCTRYTYYISF
jgi:hypothetical protein